MDGIHFLDSAISMIQRARVSLTKTNINSNNILFAQGGGSGGSGSGSGAGGAAAAGLAEQRREDRLLAALENGDDQTYDQLIDPATGMPYSEADKFDMVKNAVDREIEDLWGLGVRTPEQQARLDELIAFRERHERSHIVDTLFKAGVDVRNSQELLDNLPGSLTADTLVNMLEGDVIDVNTAEAILNGDVSVFHIDDHVLSGEIQLDINGDGVVDTIKTSDYPGYRFIEHPETGEIFPVPDGAGGFNIIGTDELWLLEQDASGNPLSPDVIEAILVHETNHALNPPPADFDTWDPGDQAVWSFESEWQAYWVDPRLEGLTDTEKANAITNLVLGDPVYAHIQQQYITDPDVQNAINDVITGGPPDGNLTNETD